MCDQACDKRLQGNYDKELRSCEQGVKAVQEYLAREKAGLQTGGLEAECSFKACYQRMRGRSCGLSLRGSERDKLRQLNGMIRKKLGEWEQAKRGLERAKRGFEMSGEVRYHAMLERALGVMQAQRTMVLGKRQYNYDLKKYLDSAEYRKVKHEVSRMGLQNDELQRQWKFWLRQKRRLEMAVRTSPLELKRARDGLEDGMKQYEADVELVEVLKGARVGKEGRIALVQQIRLALEAELERTKTVVARARAEEVFMKKASRELYGLIGEVLRNVRMRKNKVECGTGEVGRQVGRMLME